MWRALSLLSLLSVNLGRLFFSDFRPKKTETQKQDWKKTYLFLVTDWSDPYLASRPVYINYDNINYYFNYSS